LGGVAKKHSVFQRRYQKLKLRRGGQRAVIAIARAQLIAIYWTLRSGIPYPEQVRQIEDDRRELLRRLTKLGYDSQQAS